MLRFVSKMTTPPHVQHSTCWDPAKNSVRKYGFTAYYTLAHKKKLDRGVVGPLLPHIIAHCCGKGCGLRGRVDSIYWGVLGF